MSTARLFEPWPDDRLEPSGNPAYEGTGFPGAGYGQRVRQVVPLPGGYGENPQLVGWENPQPLGQKVYPRGTISEVSGVYAKSVVGLQGFGAAMTPEQAEYARLSQGMRAVDLAEQAVKAMRARVASPPFLTSAATVANWRSLAELSAQKLEEYRRTLPDAVKTDLGFAKWLDVMRIIPTNMRDIDAAYSTEGLWNALKYTFIETSATVGKAAETVAQGAKEVGKSVVKTGSLLLNPWVLAGLIVGAGAIYIFAKAGGSLVRFDTRAPEPRVPSNAMSGFDF